MATTRKSSTKKAAARKSSAKAGKVSFSAPNAGLTLSMPLDEKKIAAIHRCMEKGALKVTLTKVDLVNGKLGSAYLYD
jgi:hypothetical protein